MSGRDLEFGLVSSCPICLGSELHTHQWRTSGLLLQPDPTLSDPHCGAAQGGSQLHHSAT